MTEKTNNEKSGPVEATAMAKQIREQHESSGSVLFRPRKTGSGGYFTERLASIYEVDYSPKTVKPSQPRPCSVTRRNNPHPSHMFMNWKVPTRLIVDDPSYQQQQERLLLDSKQRFYEDINGERKYTSTSGNDVLKEVGKLRGMSPSLLPSRRMARTSTTHHVPPYGMLKHSREKDMEEELKQASAAGNKAPTPGVPKLPAVPRSPMKQAGNSDFNTQLSRNLKPRALPAAQNWLKTAGISDTKIISNAMTAADLDRTLGHTLQPDAKKAVENWLQTANERDREVAIEFFGSLAGSKLMGAKKVISDHQIHADDKGQGTCKICDGTRLQQVMDALKKGKPVASVTLKKDSKRPGQVDRRLQLLTPYTRSHKDEYQTWHHLPVFKHTGPVSNTIALFTRPHRPIPRHFTIHPEWE
ncbi:uncharacterized protein LOC110975738 isoform X2 [Acanthaster planci]|uniref:Uncharacterized protein LOC110975738 isoform X2 n=1 Tax=Acanthaster planci TaxID=133434 RepID=A0A8B7XVA4_ACAPL|nr:uncharacterized protein LOC110975738 isoform X2 [Acanthaster planci]